MGEETKNSICEFSSLSNSDSPPSCLTDNRALIGIYMQTQPHPHPPTPAPAPPLLSNKPLHSQPALSDKHNEKVLAYLELTVALGSAS